MSTSEAITSHGVQYLQLGNLPSQPPGGDVGGAATMFGRTSPLEDSTVVTTTSSTPSASQGRAGRASRRRPRASRKAPTTLLSTDAANFRALVQQFTGVPSGPVHGPGYLQETTSAGVGGVEGSTLGFGLGHLHHQQPATPFPFDMQQQQQQFPQYQQHHERALFAVGGGRSSGTGDGHVFLRGYGMVGGRNVEVSDGYLPDCSISSAVSSSSHMPNRGYMGFYCDDPSQMGGPEK